MAYIVGRYVILDLVRWRRVLAEGQALLERRGIRVAKVFRNVGDPKEFLVLLEGDDVDGLRAAWDSGELRALRHQAETLAESLYVPAP
jgi:hypothetical protein